VHSPPMKKINRQLLLFTSAVVFMALAPLVVFYAMGYRIGIDANSELSVGVLLAETTPRRAVISVDGEEIGTTPRSISNLRPGEVTVNLSKDGYQSWQKRLVIEPTAVTDLQHVRLFPLEPPRQVLLNNVTLFSLAPNRRLIAAVADNQLHLIDEEGTPIIPPVSITGPPEWLLWSPDSSSILLHDSAHTSLLNIVAGQTKPALVAALRGASDITWDPRIPGRILAVTPAGSLEAYQSTTGILTQLANNVHTFAVSTRDIFVVEQGQKQITVLNLQGQHVRTLPLESSVSRLTATPSGDLAVWDAAGTVSVITDQTQLQPVSTNAKRAGFSPDGQLLYVQTDDTSLHVFNIGDRRLPYIPLEKLSLVVRLTSPIYDAQWFAGGHHLIYQVDDEIIISEIDTRDHPISYKVDSTNLGTSFPTVGQNGERVFYLRQSDIGRQLVAASLVIE
jgi:WD40 repeat protein